MQLFDSDFSAVEWPKFHPIPRSQQARFSSELGSTEWITSFWTQCWLPLLPSWRVHESKPHKEWAGLPTLRWGKEVCATYIVLCANQTVIMRWCVCACCSLDCFIKGSNSVLVLDNTHLPYLEAHKRILSGLTAVQWWDLHSICLKNDWLGLINPLFPDDVVTRHKIAFA